MGAALAAYLSAFLVFTRRVGSKSHRYIGIGYAVAMLSTAVSGLFIYNWGHLSVFHVFAVVTIWTIGRGWLAIYRFRKTGNRQHLASHYFNMAYSFMGLNLAALAQALQIFSYDSYMQYLTATGLVYLAAVTLSNRLIRKILYPRFAPWFQIKQSA